MTVAADRHLRSGWLGLPSGLIVIDQVQLAAFPAWTRDKSRSLATREKMQPDAWTTFHTQSRLGGALLGQKKDADAEPLLAGDEGMKQRENSIPPQGKARWPEAVERPVQPYEGLDKTDEAARWTREGQALQAPAKTAETKS
jgi:eukaryotic-like serine/threonine-protein kinase